MKRNYTFLAILIACFTTLAIISAYNPSVYNFFNHHKNVLTAYLQSTEITSSIDATHIRQIITKDASHSRTIMWESTITHDNPILEYRLKGEDTLISLVPNVHPFTDDGITQYTYEAYLDPLTANESYEYRIGYGRQRSPWYTMHTSDKKEFSVLIFPDSQSSDYGVWKKTVDAAWPKHKEVDFFIGMGDLVDNGEDHSQWNAWFNGLEQLIASVPIAPIIGNHEAYNLEWKMRMPYAYVNYFSLPSNGNNSYKNQHYSFDYGDVHFVVLNTTLQELQDFQPHMIEDQIAWFKEDMAQTQKPWKVVLMHRDPLQYGITTRPERQEGFSTDGETWMPLFDEYGVHAVLSAHLHTFRDRGHIKNFERNEDGPLYILTGVAGNNFFDNLWKPHSLDVFIAPQPDRPNYMVMKASEKEMIFETYLVDGGLIHTSHIRKP